MGWLVAGTWGAWVLGGPDLSPEAEALARDHELPAELSDWSPRELRSLPDIGPRLASEIAHRRWAGELDDPATESLEMNLEAVPGIGPKTRLAVERFLQKRSSAPGPEGLRGPAATLQLGAPSAGPPTRDRAPSRRVSGLASKAGTHG